MKKSKGKFKRVEDMTQEEIREFVMKKRQCDARAQSQVMLLLENPNPISERELFECLPHMNPNHYEDVTVERAIAGACGYPLCIEALPKHPKQTYKICANTNKVYDITARKNFCSNRCFESSNHIKAQISSAPLWFRTEVDTSFAYSTLAPNAPGSVGDPVNMSVDQKVNPPKTKPSKNSTNSKNTTPPIKSEPPPEKHSNKTNNGQILGQIKERKSENRVDPIIVAGRDFSKIKCENIKVEKYKTEMSDTGLGSPPIVLEIEKSFGEWFGPETLLFIFGESRLKEMAEAKGFQIQDYIQMSDDPSSKFVSHEQYQKLCKKLNLLDLEDRKYDSEVIEANKLKPLPDYSALQEESATLNLKVRAFLKGEMSIPHRVAEDIPKVDEEELPNLPLVEKHAQAAMRRRIVLNGLDRVLPDLLRALDLPSREISGDVKQLIATFNLQAHNITFKRIQWNFIAIIIVKLLSIKVSKLESRLSMPKVNKHLELLLLSYNLEHGYLERLIWWLTDIDRLKQNKDSVKTLPM